MKRSDEDFMKFCDSLRANNQPSIVDTYLTPGAKIPAAESLSTTTAEQALPENVEEPERDWKQIIRSRRREIVDDLSIDKLVLGELHTFGVLNEYLYSHLKVELSASGNHCLSDLNLVLLNNVIKAHTFTVSNSFWGDVFFFRSYVNLIYHHYL